MGDSVSVGHDYQIFEWMLRFIVKFEDLKDKCKNYITKFDNFDAHTRSPLKSYIDKFENFHAPGRIISLIVSA